MCLILLQILYYTTDVKQYLEEYQKQQQLETARQKQQNITASSPSSSSGQKHKANGHLVKEEVVATYYDDVAKANNKRVKAESGGVVMGSAGEGGVGGGGVATRDREVKVELKQEEEAPAVTEFEGEETAAPAGMHFFLSLLAFCSFAVSLSFFLFICHFTENFSLFVLFQYYFSLFSSLFVLSYLRFYYKLTSTRRRANGFDRNTTIPNQPNYRRTTHPHDPRRIRGVLQGLYVLLFPKPITTIITTIIVARSIS